MRLPVLRKVCSIRMTPTKSASKYHCALGNVQVNHQVLLNTHYEARNSTKAALDPEHHTQASQGEHIHRWS